MTLFYGNLLWNLYLVGVGLFVITILLDLYRHKLLYNQWFGVPLTLKRRNRR